MGEDGQRFPQHAPMGEFAIFSLVVAVAFGGVAVGLVAGLAFTETILDWMDAYERFLARTWWL